MGGEERMKEFPPLVSQEFTLVGQGYLKATADIKMSSAGNSSMLSSVNMQDFHI